MKRTVPLPLIVPNWATGLALVFGLHLPFVKGRTTAKVILTFTVPLMPA